MAAEACDLEGRDRELTEDRVVARDRELGADDTTDSSPGGELGILAKRVCAAGVTTLNVAPMAGTPQERIKLIETLRELL